MKQRIKTEIKWILVCAKYTYKHEWKMRFLRNRQECQYCDHQKNSSVRQTKSSDCPRMISAEEEEEIVWLKAKITQEVSWEKARSFVDDKKKHVTESYSKNTVILFGELFATVSTQFMHTILH